MKYKLNGITNMLMNARLTAMQIQVAVSLFGSDSQKTHLLQNFILIHHAFLLNTNSNDKSNIIHSM